MRPNCQGWYRKSDRCCQYGCKRGGDADPENEFFHTELRLEIVEITKIEEQQSRGSEGRSLGPKCTLPNPIDSPIGQRHGCEQYCDVTDEYEEKNIRDVVSRRSESRLNSCDEGSSYRIIVML